MDHLCCTAPRSMTPTEPISKLNKFKPGNRRISAPLTNENTDSRYTSARTEDLKEIQQLFDPSNLVDSAASIPNDPSFSTVSSKQSKIGSFFRRHLSRQLTAKKKPTSDPEAIKQAKNEIRSTLLSEDGPEAGGYDSDAAVLSNVDETAVPNGYHNESPGRGRSKVPRQSIQLTDWHLPAGSK